MKDLELNSEFAKNKHLKSFIRVGQTFIDIKQTIGFSFIKDPTGYIIVQFVYESGRAMNTFLRNRNDFSLFLLELDTFIDDPNTLSSINNFINEIETELQIGYNNDIDEINKIISNIKHNKKGYYNKKKKYNKSKKNNNTNTENNDNE